MDDLERTAERVAEVAAKYRGSGLTEQDTKNALIEPILGVLGWPKHDLERVRAEYRPTSKFNPVDYALMAGGKPVLFVEAKALDLATDEHRFVAQVLSYANVAGVDWAVITNGHRWDLYSVFARVDARKKLFFSTTVDSDKFTTWMRWLTPDRLDGQELETFWRLVVAERRVKATVTRLFRDRDDGLVSLVSAKSGVDASEVAVALQALRLDFVGATAEEKARLLGQARASSSPPSTNAQPLLPAAPPEAKAKAKPERKARELPKHHRGPIPLPTPGTKPHQFRIADESWPVSTWKDVYLLSLQYAHAQAPEVFAEVWTSAEFESRKGRFLQHTDRGLRSPVPVVGGFAEVNLSARDLVRFSNKVLVFSGLAHVTADYVLRDRDRER